MARDDLPFARNAPPGVGVGLDASSGALSSDIQEEVVAAQAASASSEGVGRAIARGFSWNFLNFAVSQVASTLFFLILARQLRPEVFGIFALAILVVEFVTLQGKSAAVDALLQRRAFEPDDLSGFFYALVGLCTVIFALSWPLAALLGGLFHEDGLRLILPALAITIVLSPPLAIMEAIVMSRLQFKTLALRTMAGTLLGGAVGLAFVFSPMSGWALVAQRLAAVVTTLAFMFVQTKWRPGKASFKLTPTLLRASLAIWLSQALAAGIGRVGDVIIGARLGAAALGVFRVAGRIVETLHGPITNPVLALWVPVMSGLHGDAELRKRMYLNLCKISAVVCVPGFLGLGLIGNDLTHLVLSPRYSQAGPLMFWLSLIGLYIPVAYFRGPVFTALGRNRLAIGFCIIDIALYGTAIAVFAPFGLLVVARASAAPIVVSGILSLSAILHVMDVRLRDFLKAVFPAYLSATLMAIAVWVLGDALADASTSVRLSASVALGALVYAAILGLAFRPWVMDVLKFVRSQRA